MRIEAEMGVCRHERCPFVELHPEHHVPRKYRMWPEKKPSALSVLDDCVLHAIGCQIVTPTRVVHGRVVDDYGEVTDRTVYRALDRLLDAKLIVRVHPPQDAMFDDGGPRAKLSHSTFWGYLLTKKGRRKCAKSSI